MRVFYVRPSDNGNYGIEEALGNLAAPPERVDLALFRGLRLPLLPLNYDPTVQGLVALHTYDLVILAGVDPILFSSRDHLALLAFVERGGSLMLVGGTHSFGNAQGTYLPLAPLLPVNIRRGLDVEVNALPRCGEHPIARGLPEPLGYISKVHPVEVKPDAQVALHVGDHPLVVTGEWGYGRVVVVAAFPECHEAEYGWFFTGDAFDDFLRAAIAWMLKDQHSVGIEMFSLPSREVVTGTESFGKLLLRAAEPATVQLTTRLTRDGRVLYEDTTRLHVDSSHETLFSFRAPKGADAGGIHYASVALVGPDGREAARRDVAIEVVNPARTAIELECGTRCYAPGDTLRLRIHPLGQTASLSASARVAVRLVDAAGRTVIEEAPLPLPGEGDAAAPLALAIPLPQLQPGTYTLRSELHDRKKLLDVAREDVHLVPVPREGQCLPLIADGVAHLDRPTIDRTVADLAGLGINAVSLPGPTLVPWGERAHHEDMRAHAADAARQRGLRVATHHCTLLPGYRASAPLEPCALRGHFHRALRKLARPILEAHATSGRLFHEVVPQLAVVPDQTCHCAACQEAYRKNFHGELPAPDALGDLPVQARRAYYAFISSYWWAVFGMVAKLRDKVAPHAKLSLPSGATSFLRDGHRAPYADVYSWARAVDVVEVAPEPDLARYRFSLAAHRGICEAEGKTLGAVIHVANPAFPPTEMAFTALAHGAQSIRVADNPKFAHWTNQPPLQDALGDVFRRIGRAAPLLAAARRPKAQVALAFPFTQMVDEGTADLLAAHDLLCDAFGEADVIHQRLLTDEGLAGYQAVAILGTRVLRHKMRDALVAFVQCGGVLLADSADHVDQDGQPLAWPDGFFGDRAEPLFGAASLCHARPGEGHTVLLSPGVPQAHARSRGDGGACAADALRRAVADADVPPRVACDNPLVECGVRALDGAALILAVNHSDEPQRTTLVLDRSGLPSDCVFQLLPGRKALAFADGKPPRLVAELKPHDGAVWALFPDHPSTARIAPADASVSPGQELCANITLADDNGQPIQGSYPLRVQVLDPSGAERPGLGGEFVAVSGTLEFAATLALNDPPGQWRLCATEPLTGVCQHATFTVTQPPTNEPSTP